MSVVMMAICGNCGKAERMDNLRDGWHFENVDGSAPSPARDWNKKGIVICPECRKEVGYDPYSGKFVLWSQLLEAADSPEVQAVMAGEA